MSNEYQNQLNYDTYSRKLKYTKQIHVTLDNQQTISLIKNWAICILWCCLVLDFDVPKIISITNKLRIHLNEYHITEPDKYISFIELPFIFKQCSTQESSLK